MLGKELTAFEASGQNSGGNSRVSEFIINTYLGKREREVLFSLAIFYAIVLLAYLHSSHLHIDCHISEIFPGGVYFCSHYISITWYISCFPLPSDGCDIKCRLSIIALGGDISGNINKTEF